VYDASKNGEGWFVMSNKHEEGIIQSTIKDSIRYAAHSLEMEGFTVSEKDISLVENVLNGTMTEQQFSKVVQAK
jgi:hypothetical protein